MSLATAAVVALLGIVFRELFVALGVTADARRVLAVAPAAARVIRSPTLSDLDKERAVRRMSLEVLRDTLRFSAKLALVLGGCLVVALAGQWLLALSSEALLELLVSWQALLVLVVTLPLYARLRRA